MLKVENEAAQTWETNLGIRSKQRFEEEVLRMNDFQSEMRQIQKTAEAESTAQSAVVQKRQQAAAALEQNLGPILDSTARELAGGDQDLRVQSPSDGSLGFCIIHPNVKDAGQFAVSADCSKGDVTLKITDGNWEEMHGSMGNWARWTDQKEVYSGPLDEKHIRSSLKKQFLYWYQTVLNTRSN